MDKEVLLIILCIIGYIALGICAGMISVYNDKKRGYFDSDDSDANCSYIFIAIFWPLALAAVIILYPFAKLYDFFMWFGNHISSDDN